DIRQKYGPRAYFLECDLSDQPRVEATMKTIREKVADSISILINNAGVLNCQPLTELSPQAIERTIRVNLLPHFWTTKAVLPRMFQRKTGHIVAIASNFGILGRGCFTDYT